MKSLPVIGSQQWDDDADVSGAAQGRLMMSSSNGKKKAKNKEAEGQRQDGHMSIYETEALSASGTNSTAHRQDGVAHLIHQRMVQI